MNIGSQSQASLLSVPLVEEKLKEGSGDSKQENLLVSDRERAVIKNIDFTDYLLEAMKLRCTPACIDINFKGHTSRINSVAFSPIGNFLASGSYDETIKVWNIQEKREEFTLMGN